jgi:polysaccharide pyruvyl transferase WcaK-like protein
MGPIVQFCFFWLRYYKSKLNSFFRTKVSVKEGSLLHRNFGVLNPSLGSSNLGDFMILDGVQRELNDIFPNDFFIHFPTQFYVSFDALSKMRENKLIFIAGTNLLSSNLERYNQWKIHPGYSHYIGGKVVLFGCGWWQYQEGVSDFSRTMYRKLLNKNVLHSVRDSYTESKLLSIGIENVVNTSCPTLWGMTEDRCKSIRRERSPEVITTLTSYHKNINLDREMFNILTRSYERVSLWIQGLDDINYYNELRGNWSNVSFISPGLESYDKKLKQGKFDYIGTRLHAGIRALQHGHRTLILAVDNRATEIGKDVNLNVIPHSDLHQIIPFIEGDYSTVIHLPFENIERWKKSLAIS